MGGMLEIFGGHGGHDGWEAGSFVTTEAWVMMIFGGFSTAFFSVLVVMLLRSLYMRSVSFFLYHFLLKRFVSFALGSG